MLLVCASDVFDDTHRLLKSCPAVVSEFARSSGNIFWQEAEILERIEYAAFFQVVMWEAWLCTTEARVVCTRLAALAVPENAITTCTSHWPTTAYFVEQATISLTKSTIQLFSKAAHIWTTSLDKVGKECLRAVVVIDQHIANASGGDRH